MQERTIEALAYAYWKTGFVVTGKNRHRMREADLAAWEAAIGEYVCPTRRSSLPGGTATEKGARWKFIIGSSVILFLLLSGALMLFEALIHPEGSRAPWPWEMFQGAPWSHYREEHAWTLAAFRALSPAWAIPARAALVLVFSCSWYLAAAGARRPVYQLAVALVFLEACFAFLNAFFAACMAFHHVGWGMECNYQWWDSFFVLNLFLGLPALACLLRWVLVDLRRTRHISVVQSRILG